LRIQGFNHKKEEGILSPLWDDVIPMGEKEVYEKAGYGKKQGFGEKPAIVIVDMTYNFLGDKPEPILKSIERFHNSCGEWGWERIKNFEKLIEAGRKKNIPFIYTKGSSREDFFDSGRWKGKNRRTKEVTGVDGHKGTEIIDAIRPRLKDIVVIKKKPSAFFGTPLVGYLIDLEVDSLIIGGTTTSGCVRATVVDAFSYNYIVSVVEECTFDRGTLSHKVSLFELNAKYADVVTLKETIRYIDTLPEDLFEHYSSREDL
jgi:nicotinamidase-related amidase